MKPYLKLFILISILFSPVMIYGQEQSITIIYTGSLKGELEPCGCSPKTDFGGLARLSGYIKQHKDSLAPYILIDSGNFAAADTKQGSLKSETLLKFFSIMDYKAVGLMKREKELPEDYLALLVKKYETPALSNDPLYKDSMRFKIMDIEINISTDHQAPGKDMLNILLSDHSIAESDSINGWDLIISSSGEVLSAPTGTNKTIIVSGYPKGEKLGILKLKIDENGKIIESKDKLQPLGNDIEEDPAIRAILDDYDLKVAELLKESEPPEGTTYLGVSTCTECHQPFTNNWENTGHSKAFSSLEEAGKSADPECLICHTVGFGEKGGFYSIETTPGLENVQCETCHGLNREHLDDFSRPMRPVTEQVCLKCHTEDKSPDFDYKFYLDKIKH